MEPANQNAKKLSPDADSILRELERLGTAQTKKTYRNHGAREPMFGVTLSAMKPLAKKIKRDYALSKELFGTGIYDAMLLAGVTADPAAMTEADLTHWMEQAYCHGISDYIVAVTLAQTPFGQELADKWITHPDELYRSAGWSCYGWMLAYLPDRAFDPEKIRDMLEQVAQSIHESPNRVRYAMNSFLMAVGISYLPLHREALAAAERVGAVQVDMGPTSCKVPLASAYIQKAADSGRLGFKRKKMYC